MGMMFVYGLVDILSGLAVGYLSLTREMSVFVVLAALLLLVKGAVSIVWDS